jgi:carbon monoxide dehydrogenase subunit G
MELTNDFRVGVPPATAWSVLTDVERIAPCMPGAQLQEVEGDEYRGVVKVKVGPITAQYKGAATFLERDDTNLKAVLRAEGRDTRGQGNANATITATLTPDGDGTRVSVVTDLTVTGKVAQFGRGVMADVSAKLLGQFVQCLESTVLAENATATAAPPEPTAPASSASPAPVTEPAATEPAPGPAGRRTIDSAEAQPIDLLDTAGASVAKRAAPVLGVLAVLWLLRVLLKRRKK